VTIRSILSGVVCGGLLLSTTSLASAHSLSVSSPASADRAIVMHAASIAPTTTAYDFSMGGITDYSASMQSDEEMSEAIDDLIQALDELVDALEELQDTIDSE
jgi:hypothetical protein